MSLIFYYKSFLQNWHLFIYFICDLYKSLLLITWWEGGEGIRTPASPSTSHGRRASRLKNTPKLWSCVITLATKMKTQKSRLSAYEERTH